MIIDSPGSSTCAPASNEDSRVQDFGFIKASGHASFGILLDFFPVEFSYILLLSRK